MFLLASQASCVRTKKPPRTAAKRTKVIAGCQLLMSSCFFIGSLPDLGAFFSGGGIESVGCH